MKMKKAREKFREKNQAQRKENGKTVKECRNLWRKKESMENYSVVMVEKKSRSETNEK